MKLRQKLAVALASAMVITAVPVVTMAASTNSLAKETIKVSKDDIFAKTATANALRITFKDATARGQEVFYLELENAEWDLETARTNGEVRLQGGSYVLVANPDIKFDVQDKKVVKVTYSNVDPTTAQSFPIFAKATGGDAKVSVVSKGGSTTVSAGSFVFATTSDKKAEVKVDSTVPTFFNGGAIANITLSESHTGAMANTGTAAKPVKTVVTLELNNDDFDFDVTNGTLVEGTDYKLGYGFANKASNITVKAAKTSTGVLELTIEGTEIADQDSIGAITLTGLRVKSTTKTPEAGNITLDVKSEQVTSATDLVVAKVASYSNFITMKDDKAVEIVAGRIEDVEFKIGETVKNTLVAGRQFEIKLDNGYVDYKTIIKKASNVDLNNVYGATDPTKAVKFDTLTNKEVKALDFTLRVADLKTAGYIDDEAEAMIQSIEFDRDTKGNIIPETLIVTLKGDLASLYTPLKTEQLAATFKLPVMVAITNKDKENITITASGRALEDQVSVEAVKIINPFNIETEALTVKVGLQNQVGGKITLKETDKEMIKKGKFTLSLKSTDGITFAKDVVLATEGGIKNAKVTTDKAAQTATVELTRTSKEAATLTVSDFALTVDRTVPEGSYDLVISGDAIDAYGTEITIKDFIVVGTPNTQDLAANGLAKGTATFVIGEATYTTNGTTKAMDAQSYVQDPGYTMVPVRYVAEAFGVKGNDILFSNGTATIFAGNRTIQLTAGSNIAIVNGASVTMGTKVVVKEGRTYAPVGEIARILGISTEWDSATKTAKFENK